MPPSVPSGRSGARLRRATAVAYAPARRATWSRDELVPVAVRAEDEADAVEELLRGERLRDVVVRAVLVAREQVLVLRLRGDQDDGQGGVRRAPLDAVEDLHAVHLGHHDVEQHDVLALLVDQLERALAIACDPYGVPPRHEYLPNDTAGEAAFVVAAR